VWDGNFTAKSSSCCGGLYFDCTSIQKTKLGAHQLLWYCPKLEILGKAFVGAPPSDNVFFFNTKLVYFGIWGTSLPPLVKTSDGYKFVASLRWKPSQCSSKFKATGLIHVVCWHQFPTYLMLVLPPSFSLCISLEYTKEKYKIPSGYLTVRHGIDGPNRNRCFTELKNGWIFPWRTVNVITRC